VPAEYGTDNAIPDLGIPSTFIDATGSGAGSILVTAAVPINETWVVTGYSLSSQAETPAANSWGSIYGPLGSNIEMQQWSNPTPSFWASHTETGLGIAYIPGTLVKAFVNCDGPGASVFAVVWGYRLPYATPVA
jgi:hypothetical protein